MWKELISGIKLSQEPESFIIFSSKTVSKLLSNRQILSGDNEKGGLLIGCLRGNHFDVRAITTPFPKDICGPFRFERRDVKHLKMLRFLNRISKGKLTFIGEWHTHPEDIPNPSKQIDIPEWNKIKKTRNYPVVFLIVGREKYYIEKR